jgi:predicted  nucleic acid-binding Zn-ribbon protein
MIHHCTKCGMNWAKLWSQEDGNESVEFCPVCNTDTYLEESNDFVGYLKRPITGAITNAFTGQPYESETEVRKPVFRVVVGKPPRETVEEREARELAALNAYFASGNKQDYHNTIKKVK